jgi:ATP-dependent protease ClpP protease subunit
MAVPPVVYATYFGLINQEMVGRAVSAITGGMQNGMRELHLLFQSFGGTVGDGLALMTFLDALPIPVHVYNGGAVESAAVLAYLGGKHRYVSSHGTFLLHPPSFMPPNAMGPEAYRTRAKSLDIDSKRTRDVLNARTKVPPGRYARVDLTLVAQESIDLGIAHSLRDFQVPTGNQVFDLTQQRP